MNYVESDLVGTQREKPSNSVKSMKWTAIMIWISHYGKTRSEKYGWLDETMRLKVYKIEISSRVQSQSLQD